MLISYDRTNNSGTIKTDIETVDKARELINLFSAVPLDAIQRAMNSSAGQLAIAILSNQADTAATRALIDELQGEYLSADSLKEFVSRQALLNELEDVLKAKSITPYRRARINVALKRACLKCHGSGKQPRVKRDGTTLLGQPKVKHEIDSNSPDCKVCSGTGKKPELTVLEFDSLKQCTEDMKQAGENLAKELNDDIFKALGILE